MVNLDKQEQPPQPQMTIAEAIGGPMGMIEASLPTLAFVIAYSATGSDTRTSATVALGIALALAAVRLIRRQTPRHALSGLFGVAIAAAVAAGSGNAEDFFLPGLLANVVYASVFLVSVAARWPLVGLVVTKLDGEDNAWRDDPVRMRVFKRATFLWAGLFLARLVVQIPLFLTKDVVALGVVKTAMGLPLFALGLYVTYLMVRGVRVPAAPAT